MIVSDDHKWTLYHKIITTIISALPLVSSITIITLQFGASLIILIYDHNIFIIQATVFNVMKVFLYHFVIMLVFVSGSHFWTNLIFVLLCTIPCNVRVYQYNWTYLVCYNNVIIYVANTYSNIYVCVYIYI
jgi:hypothetical protein